MVKFKKSLYDWSVENGKNEFIDLWDYELNNCSPKDVGYASNKKYYFKCPRGLHNSEKKMINNLTSGSTKNLVCSCCNSYKQWCVDNNETEQLNLWDYDKNKCSPEDVSYASRKECWFKCSRCLHNSEKKMIFNLTSGNTKNLVCSSCNSIGQYLIDSYGEDKLEKLWDYEKNGKLDPFEISKCSNKKVYIKCQENEEHGSYFVSCNNFTSNGNRCPICSEWRGERKIREYLTKNNIEFTAQKTFPNLLGTGEKRNKPLSYDFYIPVNNLLIEFQGEQHYKPVDFSSKNMKRAEDEFEKRQEYDRRKREYAQRNNINLLEITHLEKDKIEEILDKIFK